MAPTTRKISENEWKKHHETIYELFHVRNLPLHSEKGKPSVQRMMHEQHNFYASISQYEAYVRKREQPKNLKKSEWRAVHAKLNELSATGIQARVKLSGQVLSREKIERSKRHALAGVENQQQEIDLDLPPVHRVAIETCGENGVWSVYNGRDAPGPLVTNDHPIPNPVGSLTAEATADNQTPAFDIFEVPSQSFPAAMNALASLDHGGSLSSLEGIQEHRASFLSSRNSPRLGCPLLPWNDPFFSNVPNPSVGIETSPSFDIGHCQLLGSSRGILTSPMAYDTPSQYWVGESPFSQLMQVFTKPKQGVLRQAPSLGYPGGTHNWNLALGSEFGSSPRILVELLLQDANKIIMDYPTSCGRDKSLCRHTMLDIDPDDVLDSLLSLLPDSSTSVRSGDLAALATTRNAIFNSPFDSAFLFSIANGFAGFRNIPKGALLRMMRRQDQMSSRLFSCLQSCPPALAKSLASNLLRSAVETCDEQAVRIILQSTRNTPNEVDVNEIVCTLKESRYTGRRFTPIELAAKFRQLGIVEALLAANADVNKSYADYFWAERGALELAIGTHYTVNKMYTVKEVDLELVRALVDHHAEVRRDWVESAVIRGHENVVQELIFRLAPNICFDKKSYMIPYIALYLRNDLATKIIRQLFGNYIDENTMNYAALPQEDIETALCHASRRGNYELAQFLVCHTRDKDVALWAAVRNGDRGLIDLMLHNGAGVGGKPVWEHTELNSLFPNLGDTVSFRYPTTPLAEAIRSRDKELVALMENLGALTHLMKDLHFEAAIFAAAELGDYHYLKKLLELAPKKPGYFLTSGLAIAILKNETDAASILLDHGADINAFVRGQNYSNPTSLPLLEALRMRNKVVIQIMFEMDAAINRPDGYYVVSEIANRCYLSPSLRDREVDYQAMELAGLWGDVTVVEDLIGMGANANSQTVALAAAVKSRNINLVNMLLGKYRVSPNSSMDGKFGGTPLAAATANKDEEMIRRLVSKGADPADHNAFLDAMEQKGQIFTTLLDAFTTKYPQGKPGFGAGPLIDAITKEDIRLVSTMLTAKFDINDFREGKDGCVTPLGFAVRHRKGRNLALVKKLIDARGDVNAIAYRPPTPPLSRFQSLQMESASMPWPSQTPLLLAVNVRSEQMVQLLLENGADVHRPARRDLKRTSLQQACEIGSYKMVKLLLEKGADANEAPAFKDGRTSLQLAAIGGSIKIAKLLLDNGAMVHAPPAKVWGRTALEGAAENGCLEMIMTLWETVLGFGFTPGEIHNAIALAKDNGHIGCAEYIVSLSSKTAFPSPKRNPMVEFGMG